MIGTPGAESLNCLLHSSFKELASRSEHDEGLSHIADDVLLLDSDDIEPDGLGKRSALSNGNNIADLGSGEGWGEMSWEVVMSLLESVVLLDVVKVISSESDGSVHFVGEDDTLEDSASDGHVRGEWALVINVVSLDGGSWGLEACRIND